MKMPRIPLKSNFFVVSPFFRRELMAQMLSWGGWYVATSMGGAMTSRLPAGRSNGSDRFYDDEIGEAFTWVHGDDVATRDDFGALYPGEPISAPPRRRGSTMRGAALVLLILSGIAWGLWKTEAVWRPIASTLTTEVMAAWERNSAQSTAMTSQRHPSDPLTRDAAPSEPLPVIPSTGKDVATAQGAAAGTAVEAQGDAEGAAAGLMPADEADESTTAGMDRTADQGEASSPKVETPAQSDTLNNAEKPNASARVAEVIPLPPLQVDPADPYQKRALAAGLHPDLSRVLLKGMSSTDYRNAREAVRKALNDASDDATFVWPRQRVPKQALFKVHFVAGAPSDCRRYVVTITKDGWTTTAQPMEQCGFKKTAAHSSS
ncbi:MAG: hypothetical protein H6875_00430 [Hyphomicrobiaceae bacterium]|nr:hypothetical protein [Hyphomicrobiaceae bacterium]